MMSDLPKSQKSIPPVSEPQLKMHRTISSALYKTLLTVIFMSVLFGTAFVIAYASAQKNSVPKSYDECSRAKGSLISKTYPAICTTKAKVKFMQPISEEEERILESNLNKNNIETSEGKFCGGIAGMSCPTGYNCKLEGTYPDAGGKCAKN